MITKQHIDLVKGWREDVEGQYVYLISSLVFPDSQTTIESANIGPELYSINSEQNILKQSSCVWEVELVQEYFNSATYFVP